VLGARFGNVGDLSASTTGLLSGIAGHPGELVRLLITASGVTGGYVQDRFEGKARLPDPDAAGRSVLGKIARPMQYPDRAGFAAYVPAGLAFLTSGVVQHLSFHNAVAVAGQAINAAGVSDILGGVTILAGYAAVILLNDARTGDVVQRLEGPSVVLTAEGDGFCLRETGEPIRTAPWQVLDLQVCDDEKGERSLSPLQYLALPETSRPKLQELRVREAVALDRLARLTRAAKGWEPGRFQLFVAGATFSTYLGWGALVDRATRADWARVMAGLATGDVTSVQFWQSLLEGGSVATQAVTAAAFTAASGCFAVARSDEATKAQPHP
jgi:hypothetical protein